MRNYNIIFMILANAATNKEIYSGLDDATEKEIYNNEAILIDAGYLIYQPTKIIPVLTWSGYNLLDELSYIYSHYDSNIENCDITVMLHMLQNGNIPCIETKEDTDDTEDTEDEMGNQHALNLILEKYGVCPIEPPALIYRRETIREVIFLYLIDHVMYRLTYDIKSKTCRYEIHEEDYKWSW